MFNFEHRPLDGYKRKAITFDNYKFVNDKQLDDADVEHLQTLLIGTYKIRSGQVNKNNKVWLSEVNVKSLKLKLSIYLLNSVKKKLVS